MTAWIARHLPQRIQFEVARQFLNAVVAFSPKGLDSTIEECRQTLTIRGKLEGWIE